MSYNFASDKPIFLQLSDIIKRQIISGGLAKGEKLKSVRELSAEFGVNPNTVQKALAELESEGLIYTDRTNGKFVTTDEKVIESSKRTKIKLKIDDFFDELQNMGLSLTEIIKLIKEKIDE